MVKDPFSAGEKKPKEEDLGAAAAEAADLAEEQDLVQLGDAAQAAIGDVVDGAAVQDPLEGTDYLKVKFVGMSMDSLEDNIALGSNLTFTVQARCVGNGTDISKVDGHEKRFVKMDVQSIKLVEDE